MSFAATGLHPLVLKALEGEGYTAATPVQAAAIPPALEGRDVLATAATGTGKTAAFLLPSLSRIATTPKHCPPGAPRILVLTPTRELSTQVTQAVRRLSRFMRINSADIVGGMPFRAQLLQLAGPLDIVVATPGRLIDHLQRGRLNLGHVDVLVLDEADRMLDMGFAEDVALIAKSCAPTRQTLLFTATLDQRMSGLAARLLKNPARVTVAAAVSSAPIEQRLYHTEHFEHKRRMLHHFASSPEVSKAIVFVATKRDCDVLADELNRAGHSAAPLHGDMDQSQRNHTMHRMRGKDLRLLVATDVAARGIDVRDISHVINFDLPRAANDYVHRIGRTGRAGASGIAISFAGAGDRGVVRNIERLTRAPLKVHTVTALLPAPVLPASGTPRFEGRPADRFSGRPGGHSARPFGRSGTDRSHAASPQPGRSAGDKPGSGKPHSGRPGKSWGGARMRKADADRRGKKSWFAAR